MEFLPPGLHRGIIRIALHPVQAVAEEGNGAFQKQSMQAFPHLAPIDRPLCQDVINFLVPEQVIQPFQGVDHFIKAARQVFFTAELAVCNGFLLRLPFEDFFLGVAALSLVRHDLQPDWNPIRLLMDFQQDLGIPFLLFLPFIHKDLETLCAARLWVPKAGFQREQRLKFC